MDEPADGQAWRFDRFLLDVSNGGLFRLVDGGGHEPVPVGSRALDVLAALVARAGELVAKRALMDAVWPGTAVEEKNLTVQISSLRRVLDQGRTGESCIQTVAGRGYRLAIRATRVGATLELPLQAILPPATSQSTGQARSWMAGRGGSLVRLFVAVVGIALTTGAIQLFRPQALPPVPPRLSVAVLPFRNLGGSSPDDRTAGIITEDLITDLSRVPGMSVVALRTSRTDRVADPRQAGGEAGVRYVLEGSVRRLGGTIRVNAQVISAESGAHLWAERLDQDMTAPGADQDDLVRRLGQGATVALIDLESARSKRERPTNPDAVDLMLRVRSLSLHPMGVRERAERARLCEQALQLDPKSLVAMTYLATELIRLSLIGEGDELGRAGNLIRDARAIDPTHPFVLDTKASLLVAQGRYSEAIAAYRGILNDHPDATYAHNEIGLLLIFAGRSEEALLYIHTAIDQAARHARVPGWYGNLGLAALMLERDVEAIAWTERALAGNPSERPFMRANLNIRLAAAHARLGQVKEARRAIAEADRAWPHDTVRMHWPDNPDSPIYAAQIKRFQAALRMVGHRDHAEEDADFGAPSDGMLQADLAGWTPTTVPGARVIRTAELATLITEQNPIVIDPLLYSWGRSIPGAVGLRNAGVGGSYSDTIQDRLRLKMSGLTKGDVKAPIIAAGFNAERFDGRNLTLRLVALGYTNVHWYRGGREAWEVSGLPETEIDVQGW